MSTTHPHDSSMISANSNDDLQQPVTADDDHARREWLINNLGEPVCRQLEFTGFPMISCFRWSSRSTTKSTPCTRSFARSVSS